MIESSLIFSKILERTPFTKQELSTLIKTAHSRYATYYIPKKNGSGQREISQPTKELKLIQSILVDILSPICNIDSSAKAYIKGVSIRDHALPHAKNKYLLKIDFKDFFQSIDFLSIYKNLKTKYDFSHDELLTISLIACKQYKNSAKKGLMSDFSLAAGATSSPFISNAFMYDFDKEIREYCTNENITYTRYADDLAFSTNRNNQLSIIDDHIKVILNKELYKCLTINNDKTVNSSRKHKRFLTGLILSNDGKASIGREKKRLLRAKMHESQNKGLSLEEFNKLIGQLSFTYSIDECFVSQLISKYNYSKVSEVKNKKNNISQEN